MTISKRLCKGQPSKFTAPNGSELIKISTFEKALTYSPVIVLLKSDDCIALYSEMSDFKICSFGQNNAQKKNRLSPGCNLLTT